MLSPRARYIVMLAAPACAMYVVAAACSSAYSEDPNATRPPSDADVSESEAMAASDGGGSVDPCAHAGPPPAPTTDDDPTATGTNAWFAFDRIIVPITPDAGVGSGVDLDRSCTCGADLFDGAPPCETPASTRTSCDFDGGIDDAMRQLALQYAGALSEFDPGVPLNTKISTGGGTSLLYLSGYNGKANDREVGVAFVRSGGLYTDLGCNDKPRDAGPPQSSGDSGAPGPRRAPIWDGCDRWSPKPGLVIGDYPNRMPLSLTHGYVSNYMLVAEGVAVEFDDPTTVSSGVLVARLSPDSSSTAFSPSFRVDGFIAGRIDFAALVSFVARTEVPAEQGPVPFCETPFWPNVKPSLCGARDTMITPKSDHHGEICNAATVTFGFAARRAQVSSVEWGDTTPSSPKCDLNVICR